MKQIVKTYVFSASAKTITLSDFSTVSLERLQLIVDTTTNTILYNFADSSVATATVATNVITLSTVGTAASTDKLQIVYDAATNDPTYDTPVLPNGAATAANQTTGNASLSAVSTNTSNTATNTSNIATVEGTTTDAAVVGDSNGTISAKLRGLTKIFNDIWDSVNHRIKVDGSGVTQPISGSVTANAGTNLNTSALALESGGNLAGAKTDLDTLAGTVSAAKVQTNETNSSTIATNTNNIPAKGQATMANSTPVAIASNQSAIPVTTPADVTPATQNITVQDTASATATGANSQSIITGTPTAGSTASFAFNTKDSIAVQVTGTWTGTLQCEVSFDGGTTWYMRGLHQSGTSYIAASFTANFSGAMGAAGATNMRLRAIAAMTGTATVLIVETANVNSVYIANTVKLSDGTTASTQNTIKPASTAPVATDTALVVAESPNSQLVTNTGNIPAKGAATTANSTPVNIASDQTVPVSSTTLATAANQTTGNSSLSTIATDVAPLVAAGAGGYVRQDSNATIAKESGGNLATIVTNTGNIPAKGQATMVNSTPVAIASNQSTLPVQDTAAEASLTTIATNTTGLATSANQTNGTQQTKTTDGTNIANVIANDTGYNGVATNNTTKVISFTTSIAGAQTLAANTDVRGYSSITIIYTAVGVGLALSGQFAPNSGGTYITAQTFVNDTSATSIAGALSASSGGIYRTPVIAPYFQLNVTALTSGTFSGYIILSTAPMPYHALYAQQSQLWSTNSNATGTAGTIISASSTVSGGSLTGYGSFAAVSISGTYAGVSFGITVKDTSGTFFNVPIYDSYNMKWLSPGTTITPGTNASNVYWVPHIPGSTQQVKVTATAWTSGTANIEIGGNAIAGNAPSLLTNNIGGGSIAYGQVSAATTATQIVAARIGRKEVVLTNNSTVDVFIGDSSVTTTTGLLLAGIKGQTVRLLTQTAIYGIVATGTETVSYMEEY